MVNGIAWREGLFIRPQHFQQNDRHHEYQIRTHALQSRSNNWGFYELEFDEHFLNAGKLVLNRAHGLIMDGTLIDITTKSHNLVITIEPSDAGKTIYLALALDIDRTDILCFEEDKVHLARLIAKRERDVPNTNSGENSVADIVVTRHNFLLLREEELNEGYSVIPIAQIGAVADSGSVTLDSVFVPTYLHSHKNLFLIAQLKELNNILNFRIVKLSEKLSDSTIQVAELGDYLMLGLINRYYNRFHFFLSQEKVHPQEIYLELISLASELSIFMKKEKHINGDFKYNHKLQKESFALLLHELKTMLSAVLEQNSIKMPIEARKYGIYVSKIEDKTLIDTCGFVLAVSSDIPPEKLKKMVMDNLKIGTIETIRDLVNYHLAGYRIKVLPTAPRQIPYRVNHTYFQLDITAEEKKVLHTSGGMALHLTGEIEGIEYHLWAIRGNND